MEWEGQGLGLIFEGSGGRVSIIEVCIHVWGTGKIQGLKYLQARDLVFTGLGIEAPLRGSFWSLWVPEELAH